MILLALLACEPAPILPPDPLADDTDADGRIGKLPGPDPWRDGELRLSLAIFYEGGASDLLLIDDVEASYFIYQNDFTGVLTYEQAPDIDRVEGLMSDRITHGSQGYFGGGIVRTTPADLTGWDTLHVSFKSASPSFASFWVVIEGGGREGRVDVTDHGFVNDGDWHHLAIPMTAWTDLGVALDAVRIPFSMLGEGGTAGDVLLVDNLYLTAEDP